MANPPNIGLMKTTSSGTLRTQPVATATPSAAEPAQSPSKARATSVDSVERVGKRQRAHAGDVIAWHSFATALLDKMGVDDLVSSQRLAVAVKAQMDALATPSANNATIANAAIASVLATYFPTAAVEIDAFATKLGTPKSAVDVAVALGIAVDSVSARIGDGTGDERPIKLPEGKWLPKDPNEAPLHPRWGAVRMWVAANDAVTVGPPPAEGTPLFAHSYKLVRNSYDVRRVLETDAPEKRKQFARAFVAATEEWANERPWNDALVGEIKAHNLSPQATAKLLFAYHAARADAYVAVWKAKFDPTIGFVRRPWQIEPQDPIREAVKLPNAPSYPSAHAAQGGAISTLLAQVFPEKTQIWMSMAADARASRIVGGLSYLFDSAGIEMGRQVVVNVMKEVGITA
jgi:hypothetical protein